MTQTGAVNREIMRCTTSNVWEALRSLAHGSVIDRVFNHLDLLPLELMDDVLWGHMRLYLRDR